MEGWKGVALRVDLSEGKTSKEPLEEGILHKYVGGRGLNSRILYKEINPGIDPLGPANKVIVGVGPCNGTLVPGSQRFTFTSKSPLTGMLGDSNSGGSFGAELKYAGYDMVIIQGQAEKPVYLWIDDDRVALKPAAHLWGKTIRETRRAIEVEIGDPNICTVAIGPAGEKMVRFACLIADLGRALGRTGIGAVLGSKKLKAIAVRGTNGVKVAHPEMLGKAVKQIYDGWRKKEKIYQDRVRYGPAAGLLRYERFGMFGARNFQQGSFGEMKSTLNCMDEYYLKEKSCFSCPVGCDHRYIVDKGAFVGTYGEGFELAQPADFGPRIGCSDVQIAYKASTLCDEYGLDIFDMAGTIAYLMECFERGILTLKDTDGLNLDWGNGKAIFDVIRMTAYREGIGDILAQGLKRASEIIGKESEKYAMQVKGQSFTIREPRASKGWGLAYAVSSRGSCHVRASLPESYPDAAWDPAIKGILEKYEDPTNPSLEEGKAELVAWHENLSAFKNSMEICLFSIYPWMGFSQPTMLAQLYNAATGLNISEEDVLHIGERIVNLERAFNVREGLTRQDDSLPARQLEEPLPDGPAKGQVVKLEKMLDEYYSFRRWDRTSGFPTREILFDLGLKDVVEELEGMGKLTHG